MVSQWGSRKGVRGNDYFVELSSLAYDRKIKLFYILASLSSIIKAPLGCTKQLCEVMAAAKSKWNICTGKCVLVCACVPFWTYKACKAIWLASPKDLPVSAPPPTGGITGASYHIQLSFWVCIFWGLNSGPPKPGRYTKLRCMSLFSQGKKLGKKHACYYNKPKELNIYG